VFLKSVGTRSSTTLLCLVLAYPLAALIAQAPKRHRDLLLLLVILPFWSNFLIRIYAWMIILGPQAALARGVNALLAAFGQEPVLAPVQLVRGARLPRLRASAVHGACRSTRTSRSTTRRCSTRAGSGRQRVAAFWRITFPLSLPGVYAGAALVFIPALGIFAIPDILAARRQPDRQRDQAAVPRDARLAVRQRAVDRADRRRAGARRLAAWSDGATRHPSSAGRRA
jgi:spermidine/putrescine transport system permease protein